MTIRAEIIPCTYGWGIRQVIGVLGFFAVANGYIQRFCLSLAITEMVSQRHVEQKIDQNSCPMVFSNETIKTHASTGEFLWNEHEQGLILAAFFWGYVVTQLPGGMLAERYGAKYVLGLGMLASTISTLLTPIVSRSFGVVGLVVLRTIMGLGQGPLYPALNVLMSHWAPQLERGRMGALVFAGAQLGNVVSMAASGFIIDALGWSGVFYIFGAIGSLWFALWLAIFASNPVKHPWISDAEKDYITQNSGRTKYKDLPPTPWGPILKSVPLWGLVIAQIGHDWGLFTIITDLPKYMSSVLHFSVKSNGIISGMPYLVMWIFAIISGWIVDWLVAVKRVDVTLVRKIFVSIASIGPSVGIIAASYAGCDKVLTSVFFIFGMGTMGAFIPSLKVNALDLSPNFAGTLMALVGGIGAISGIFTPYLVGVIAKDSTLLQWRIVFWIAVSVLVGTNTIYLFLGSGKRQWWNDPDTLHQYNAERAERNEKTEPNKK